ncbi:unnamed protein product [Heligmosomoides polygyrus]|uniref:Reverse transcriptase domain-containing protein n=1 Tax=Heligmosomoides polygyrus TaxID=6339 RepID=A0A183FYE8_HELPZ|nr:unnamed protein product [Heligmosomoides polygyrus]
MIGLRKMVTAVTTVVDMEHVKLMKITLKETEAALKKMKPGKATDPDGIAADLWTLRCWYPAEWLTKFFNQVVAEKKVPDDIIFASEEKSELERQAQDWYNRLAIFGLKLNVKKYLTTDGNEADTLRIHDGGAAEGWTSASNKILPSEGRTSVAMSVPPRGATGNCLLLRAEPITDNRMQATGPSDRPANEDPVSHHMVDDVSEFSR